MLADPFTRARGMLFILRHFPGQRRVPFLPREQVLALRDARVREIVAWAAETVPFYRDLFRREGIDPRGIRTADDLLRLPLICREDVRADPDAFRSTSPRVREGVELRSSGTAGMPLGVFHDRDSVLANIAHSERERAVESRLCGKQLRYTALFLGSAGPPGNLYAIREFAGRTSFRPFRPRLVTVPTEGPVDRVVEEINRIRPEVLRGTGAFIEAFFRSLGSKPPGMHVPRVIVYGWDAMTPEGRRFVEETFGITVLSRYSAMESLKIGFFCEERSGFHLHEDLCLVTIVGEDGRTVADGAPGEVAISNLVNRGTVLLNYRLGDVARIGTGPCTCGRSSRLLVELEGRVTEVIRLPDGSLIHPRGIGLVVNRMPGVVRFQLVQRAPTSFELRLATLDRHAFEQGADAVVAGLRALLPGCDVHATHKEDLQPEPGRKWRSVVLL